MRKPGIPRRKRTRPKRQRGPHRFGEFDIPSGATVKGFARYFPTAEAELDDDPDSTPTPTPQMK
jgi:hypothetical protein